MENEQQKMYLEEMLVKVKAVVLKGTTILRKIPLLAKKTQENKMDSSIIDSIIMNERIQRRRYGTKQAADMAGISHTLLYAAENDGRLPKPDMRTDTLKKTRAGYTINQINQIRDVFGTRPSKPKGARAAILGVMNLKGGSQKTTNCHLYSQYLATKGYKVLVVDTDPQGSLSFYFGQRPDHDVNYENTIAPFLLEDEETLLEYGHPPGTSESLHYAVQKTYWDNIDIIPSCLQNLHIDLLMPELMRVGDLSPYDNVMKLRKGLLDVSKDYDFVIIDGTPSLNLSTLNVISACDIVFVPTPASMLDYASTVQFVALIEETIETYQRGGFYPNIPDLRFFITKFSKNSYAVFMASIIRKVFGIERGDVLTNEAKHSDEIGKASNSIYSIYEINPSEADNRKRLKETVESFDALYDEMLKATFETCFDKQPTDEQLKKIDEIIQRDELMQEEMASESGSKMEMTND